MSRARSIDFGEIARRREEFWNSSPAYKMIYDSLKKQGYHFIGLIGVVKRCHWTREALVNKRFCYKCLWYGIESHRCIQMSPTAAWCWLRCRHCWRIQPEDIGMHWDETRLPVIDDPEVLVEESIRVQRQIISGYKGNPRVDPEMFEEAMNPKHVAISLTGEPTLYPRLGELIREYHRRGMTTFLVTHGVRPDILASLEEEPSQLYLSLESWNREKFMYFNRPIVPRAWELVMQTIDLFPSFKSPTVYRITIVKGFNDSEEALEGFARLIERGNPTYVEVKAYMYVGYSRGRLTPANMPKHEEIRNIARRLSELTGYIYLSESIPSRIVLLSRIKEPVRHGKGCPEGVRHPEKYAPAIKPGYEEMESTG